MWSSCAGNMRPQRNASTNCERGPPLALEHAILVSLLEEPLTGYELAKKFDSSVGFFWKASHQQIYLSLKKLRDRELIGATRVNQTDRPNKVVYHIADGGIEDAVLYLSRMFEGMGDEVGSESRTSIKQSGLRAVRGLEGKERDLVLACWLELWRGTLAARRVRLLATVHEDGDGLLWELEKAR